MKLLKDFTYEYNIICIANLHQIDLAKEHADQIIGIRNGQMIFNDTADKLDKEAITELYGSSATKELA